MSWNETRSSSDELLRTEMSLCIDACRTCELYCTLAMDVAAKIEEEAASERRAAVLRVCALLCEATASSMARMRSPDVDAVAEALLACRVACRAASSECRRRSFDVCCDECADACGACATICETLLARTELAAA